MPLVARRLLWAWLAGATAVAAQRPNLVHVMVDDAGPGDFTCYWADSPVHTPNLDALAAEGMRFTQAYAGGANCAPSRSALMTGRHLGHAYLRSNAGSIAIRDVDVTIAEVLRAAGYATGGYGKWGLGPPGSPGAPERQGFDEFVGYYDQVHAHSHFPGRLYDSGQALLIPENAGFQEPETGLVADSRVHAHGLIFERMRSFIGANAEAGRPFYAWGAWTPPHRKSTLNQREALLGGLYERYDGRPGWDDFDKVQAAYVTWIDRQVGQLLATLRDPNGDGDSADSVLESTLLIVTSDNGGWQSEHEWPRNAETRDGQTVVLRGAKEGYYEGGLRTPMIAYWPGTIRAGSKSNLPVAFYDFLPTFAELAGDPAAAPPGTDGVSFAPTITGRGEQRQRAGLYFEGYRYDPNSTPTRVARMGDWKMIKTPDGVTELYDLAADPSEQTNRASDPTARDQRCRLSEFIDTNHTPIGSHFAVLPPQVGSGSARRDGVMTFGVRPEAGIREWTVDVSGDARSLVGPARDDAGEAIAVYLDDLHTQWTAELCLTLTGGAPPVLTVELAGQSGFVYFRGSLDADRLDPDASTRVRVAAPGVGVSPSSEQLNRDLGAELTVRVFHDGPPGVLRADRLRLVGVKATLGPPAKP